MSTPPHTFEFRFDEAFVRRALRRDWMWRGIRGAVAMLAILAGILLWPRLKSRVSEEEQAGSPGEAAGS